MISIAILLCIFISCGSFAWGYSLAGYDSLAHWILAFAVFWLMARWQRWRWVFTLAVLSSLILAIFGIWFNFIVGWMFSGVAFALLSWDLSEFRERMRSIPAREDVQGMIRRRILRLSLLILSVLGVASVLMLAREQFTRDWRDFLLGVIVLSLFQSLAWIRGSKRA